MKVKNEWKKKGYIEEPVDESLDLKVEIRRLAKEKDAVILAHYYTRGEIQEVADFIGDSLALARKAAETDAKIIVMAGVHFMAETCKILSPEKLVLCPDLNAGCSLADSCKAEDLRKYKEEHPGYTVISYVNTTAAVKALTDVVVTSGNAKNIVDQLPKNEKIIFGPDYNLGSYINSVTGRDMLLWNGGCHVHERFSVEEIVKLKEEHPEAVVLAHPECKGPVLAIELLYKRMPRKRRNILFYGSTDLKAISFMAELIYEASSVEEKEDKREHRKQMVSKIETFLQGMEQDECILCRAGKKAFLTKKLRFEDHPSFKESIYATGGLFYFLSASDECSGLL